MGVGLGVCACLCLWGNPKHTSSKGPGGQDRHLLPPLLLRASIITHTYTHTCTLQVSDAFVASDRETGRSRGFGFVTMDQAGGNDAIAELNETDFMGRTIRVNEAQPQGDRPREWGGEEGRGLSGEQEKTFGDKNFAA